MYTVFDEKEERYVKVEEPDPSLTYTYTDYLRWRFEERLELLRGKIFQMSGPNTRHQVICGRLFAWLHHYLERQKCHVFSAPFDVRLPAKGRLQDDEIMTVVQPDICVICDETRLDDRGCCGAPDLVVEILSPGNSKKEVRLKYEVYEEAGVGEYWIINPSEENVVVHALSTSGKFEGLRMYAGGDTIRSIAVPGFELELDRLFEK
ncbi:MAG TPA: Uma2 family endonuclease [Cyclobacteriaceae bacterium]|nr:Uma2 family endonuclease [Cyclobacteriaceae bacterium]